jgi:hypothetical protein
MLRGNAQQTRVSQWNTSSQMYGPFHDQAALDAGRLDEAARGDTVRRFEFTMHIYAGIQFKKMLMDAGFIRPKLYGDVDGRPFAHPVNALVVVAQKD